MARPSGRPRDPRGGRAPRRVGLLTGCVQRVVFRDVNAATAACSPRGYEVVAPPAGLLRRAVRARGTARRRRAFARALVDAFERRGRSHRRQRGGLRLAPEGVRRAAGDDRSRARGTVRPRVRDVSELLSDGDAAARRHPLRADGRVPGLLPPAARPARARRPRAALAAVPGLEVVEPAEQELAAARPGSAASSSRAADELGHREAANVLATGAEAYASANPGCLIQVSNALRREKRPLPSPPVEAQWTPRSGTRRRRALAGARR